MFFCHRPRSLPQHIDNVKQFKGKLSQNFDRAKHLTRAAAGVIAVP